MKVKIKKRPNSLALRPEMITIVKPVDIIKPQVLKGLSFLKFQKTTKRTRGIFIGFYGIILELGVRSTKLVPNNFLNFNIHKLVPKNF